MKFDIRKNKKLIVWLLSVVIILVIGVMIVPKAFAQPQPISEIEIFSEKADYTKKVPGAWKVTKSAKWLDRGTAEIRFDVDTIMKTASKDRDVLFVIDVSGSMLGDRISKVKSDANDLIEKLLTRKNNKAGIITFAYEGEIVANLTNNKDELISKINGLTADGGTSYYQGLMKVDELLEGYTPEKNKDLVVLLLTDGYPSVDVPNELGQYNYLKDKYPFMILKEMGSDILDAVKNVSDEQYIADMETLNNVLFSASDLAVSYDNFEIIDFIDTDNFLIDSEKDIKTSFGKTTLNELKDSVSWRLDNFKSGATASMRIKVRIKSELLNQEGLYSTNNKEQIYSKIESLNEDIESSKTPILGNKFKVTYDSNVPSDCEIENLSTEEKHSVFDTVKINDSKLKCDGYQFKGWKMVNDGIEKVNDDYFIMPYEDVIIRAEWGKVRLTKSTRGSVLSSYTLYKQVENDTLNNRNARIYTGDTSTFNGKEKIYYYYGEADNNNVLFANYCWKIVRTTDTGGVKLIYNGSPDSNGTCRDDRPDHFGFRGSEYIKFPDIYYYGDNYSKDDNSKKFTLVGNVMKGNGDKDTTFDPTGKYVCLDSSSCSSLYYVDSYTNYTLGNDYGYVTELNYSTNYASLGDWPFNSNSSSLGDVGYMYNFGYSTGTKNLSVSTSYGGSIPVSLHTTTISTDYYFASSVKYEKGDLGHMFQDYHLVNPYKVSSSSQYSNLIGKYFIDGGIFSDYTGKTDGPNAGYILGIDGSYVYYIQLSDGKFLKDIDKTYTFYDSVVVNSSGKYVGDSTKISRVKLSQWYKDYQKYVGKYYVDSDGAIYLVKDASLGSPGLYSLAKFTHSVDINSLNYKYGTSFTYDKTTGKYTVSGETQYFADLDNDLSKISNKHYTCLNLSGICDSLSYYYATLKNDVGNYIYFVNLTNGNSIQDAINNSLSADEVNTKNSTMKELLDKWYDNHMKDYTDLFEDAVWCNDRTISDLGPLDPNSSISDKNRGLSFNLNFTNLTCSNGVDRFTVNRNFGNGKLKYPLGLITAAEFKLTLKNNKSFLSEKDDYWTMSPYKSFINTQYNAVVLSCHEVSYDFVSSNAGVRPAVSLRKNISFSHGSGSVDNPYVIETNGNS